MKDLTLEEFLAKYQKKTVGEYPNHVLEAMPNPKVSVVIVTYNHAPFIRECLDGVLMQETDFPFEILIGEDESNDGTREICIEYAQRFPEQIRLFLHRRENNIFVAGVPTGNFQVAYSLYNCRARYIALCEGDDYWSDAGKIQKQFDLLEQRREYSLSSHDARVVDSEGNIISETMHLDDVRRNASDHEMKCGIWIPTLARVFRNCFEVIPEEFLHVVNADRFLTSILGREGGAYFHHDISNVAYRKHRGGIWTGASFETRTRHQLITDSLLIDFNKRIGSDPSVLKTLRIRLLDTRFRLVSAISFSERPIQYAGNFFCALGTAIRLREIGLGLKLLRREAARLYGRMLRFCQ